MTRAVKFLWRLFFFGLLAVVAIFVLANYGVFGKMPSLEDLENPEADRSLVAYEDKDFYIALDKGPIDPYHLLLIP